MMAKYYSWDAQWQRLQYLKNQKSNMQLFNKLQDEYDQLWKMIIRPSRTTYPDSALGPETFYLENIKVKRNSFQLINDRGLVFYGSHFVPLEAESYPCVIYLHGNSSNQTEGMEYLGELIRNNISLCTFDFSGCGNSEGEYVTLGHNEWKDVEEIWNYLKGKKKVREIGLWGRSMGAVTALKYAHKNLGVRVAVYDCPFKSLKELIQDICKKNSKIPSLILAGALKIIAKTIKEKANFSIYDLDPLKDDAPHIQIPGYFIVADQDELIPPTHSQSLFQAYKCPTKQIRQVKGDHNSNRPEPCIKQAIRFLKKYLSPQHHYNKDNADDFDKFDKFEGAERGQEVNFFGDDVVERGEKTECKKNIEEIDFFAEEVRDYGLGVDKGGNGDNGENFGNFVFENEENAQVEKEKVKKQGASIPGLNQIFSTVFSKKKQQKSKKLKLKDGYDETRNNLTEILGMNLLGVSKKNRSQKQYDQSFSTLFQENPSQYLWWH